MTPQRIQRKRDDDGNGCVIFLAIIAFAIGAGCLWGAGVGWLFFGGILLTLILVSA